MNWGATRGVQACSHPGYAVALPRLPQSRLPLSAILLRLLLCLSLLVSSIGSTTAGAHTMVAPPATTADAVDGETAGTSDCGHAPPAVEVVVQVEQDEDDCLQRCLDLWLQHCVAAFVAMPVVDGAMVATRVFEAPASDWVPRATTPPTRPPIA